MIEFLGHFHPLLVHLPIGILFIALLLQLLSSNKKYASFAPAISFILLFGSVTAFASCITGYFLSISDDYNESMVSWHMWMGIAVATFSLLMFLNEKYAFISINKKIVSIALLIPLTITGHLGGSLTHGSDYLSKPLAHLFSNDSAVSTVIKPIPNVQEAVLYNDIVSPILQTKCYSCHNANKQKGGLRMDQIELLMKGGKDGKIIVPGNADASEMIKRLLLPSDNEDHMPPKEKPQLTESQIALLHWWITNNADAQKKVKDLSQTDKIKPILTALQTPVVTQKERTDIPVAIVSKADEKIMDQLKARNVVVLPVAQNTNYLMANFITDSVIDQTDLQLLLQLKPQLIWLKLSNTNISDDAMPVIAQLSNLTRLDLSNTLITDKTLPQIASLRGLQYLNLVGIKITVSGLKQLKALSHLQTLYLFKTGITLKDFAEIKTVFPKTIIDTGGYKVPLFTTDTTVVKVPKM